MAIFIPEIFSDVVNERLGTTLRFGGVAFDATALAPEIMNAGEKVHFPKLKRTATVADVVKGTALKQNTTRGFKDPKNYGTGKLEQFNEFIQNGDNVVSTHALFNMTTDDTKAALEVQDYTLILDEVMDVVSQYKIKPDDLQLLLDKEIIRVGENNLIEWNENCPYKDTSFNEIMTMAHNKSLIYINNSVIMWNFPVEVFKYFKEVIILTYQFEGQVMRSYYDYYGCEYEKYGVAHNAIDDQYYLKPYNQNDEYAFIHTYGSLIHVYDGKLNDVGEKKGAFSSSWYKKATKSELVRIKNNIYNFFANICKSKAPENIWTTFVDYQNTLSGKGYTKFLLYDENGDTMLNEDGKAMYQECFVSCSMRATNDYADTFNLAYCVNRYLNPVVVNFFKSKNIEFDNETFALSEMIQWIFRARIRKGEPINLYVPSKRMRTLLQEWISQGELYTNNKVA